MEPVETQTTPVNTPRGTSGTQMSPPSVANTQNGNQTARNFLHNQILVKEVRKRLHKIFKPNHNHSQAPVMMAQTQPQVSNPGI